MYPGKNDKTFYTKLFSGDQAFDSPDSDESPGDERHSSENKSVINKSEISLAVWINKLQLIDSTGGDIAGARVETNSRMAWDEFGGKLPRLHRTVEKLREMVSLPIFYSSTLWHVVHYMYIRTNPTSGALEPGWAQSEPHFSLIDPLTRVSYNVSHFLCFLYLFYMALRYRCGSSVWAM